MKVAEVVWWCQYIFTAISGPTVVGWLIVVVAVMVIEKVSKSKWYCNLCVKDLNKQS